MQIDAVWGDKKAKEGKQPAYCTYVRMYYLPSRRLSQDREKKNGSVVWATYSYYPFFFHFSLSFGPTIVIIIFWKIFPRKEPDE